MRIDISDTFALPRDAFLELFFDERFQIALHEHLQFHHRKVLQRDEDAERMVRRVDYLSNERLPWVARKLWGDYVGWIEEMTHHKADHRVETRILPKVLGRYVDVRATLRFSEAGADRCRRDAEINVKVWVPAFGRVIARKVALNLKDGFAEFVRFTDGYIADRRHEAR